MMSFSEEGALVALQIASSSINEQGETASQRALMLWMGQIQLRANAWKHHLQSLIGEHVFGGPFKGMTISKGGFKACWPSVMLGCYEHELHPTIEEICKTGYDTVLNIGCSFGYYAVGLALRMPQTRVIAFDIDANARRQCEEMVAANGVSDRVEIAGEFRGTNFEELIKGKTLVLMDIEGAEKQLLDPVPWPALQHADVLVEIHELDEPGLIQIMRDRFANTHDVTIVDMQSSYFPEVKDLFGSDQYINPFDHLILGWEGRAGPTPWGWFKARK